MQRISIALAATIVTVTVTLLLSPASARAEKVAVLPVQATNLTDQEADAIGSLLAQAYAAETRQPVITPAEIEKAGELQGGAVPGDADQYIETTAVRLATKIKIQAVLRARDGSEIHRSEAMAVSLDDVDPIVKRLAVALRGKVAFDGTRSMHNITLNEASGELRLPPQIMTVARVGGVYPVASGKSFSPSVAATAYRRSEWEKYFWELGVGVMLGSSSVDRPALISLHGDFGGGFFLADTTTSPYLGGGLSARLIGGGSTTSTGNGSSSDGIVGLAPYANLGIETGRAARAGIHAELRISQNLMVLTYDGREVRPTELGLFVGMGF